MRLIAEKLGLAEKAAPPEVDERTAFWLAAFDVASRGRPYTMGAPLPLPPLDMIDLADRLGWPAQADEAVAVLGAMDGEWLDWRDKRPPGKSAKQR